MVVEVVGGVLVKFGYFGAVAKRKREDTTVEFIARDHKVLSLLHALPTVLRRLNFWHTVFYLFLSRTGTSCVWA